MAACARGLHVRGSDRGGASGLSHCNLQREEKKMVIFVSRTRISNGASSQGGNLEKKKKKMILRYICANAVRDGL